MRDISKSLTLNQGFFDNKFRVSGKMVMWILHTVKEEKFYLLSTAPAAILFGRVEPIKQFW